MRLYVGTYTRGETGSEGIYRGDLNINSGELRVCGLAARTDNPGFISLSSDCRYLYSVNEVNDYRGQSQGATTAYKVMDNGLLTELGYLYTGSTGPCHVTVHPTGDYVFVANYYGGAVTLFRCGGDGSLKERVMNHQHEGKSIDPERQQEAHPHSVNLSPDSRYLFVPDLGTDQINIYKVDDKRPSTAGNSLVGRLSAHGFISVEPGSGPRHFAFHTGGRVAYCINELSSSITAFAYDDRSGKLTNINTVSTLPENFAGHSHCADIHVHPTGKFVYGSNRGHDSITIFAVEDDGRLTQRGFVPTLGQTPRNFSISPDGNFLIVANQDSNTIVTFRIDLESGMLRHTGYELSVPSPVCVVIVPGT